MFESVRIKNCYTLSQHCLIIFYLLWVSVLLMSKHWGFVTLVI